VRLEPIAAPADFVPDVPISRIGTKGLFTKTLEDALLSRHIDVAVHSLKDLASVATPGLTIAAIPPREDPREALVTPCCESLAALPSGARVGTGSARRRSQLLHLRPDLLLLDIRGNVDTRLRKLAEGHYDALVLAAAGLHRLDRRDAIAAYVDVSDIVPAGGQGALGIQARDGDRRIIDLVTPLADPEATICCTAERRLQEVLDSGCRLPIGVLAELDGASLSLEAVVASEDGARLVRKRLAGPSTQPKELADRLADDLLRHGADEILREVRSTGE
jgi:hydroxymethylbilane synthase